MTVAHSDIAPAPRPMLHALAKAWWLVLLRGIAAIVFGVLAFVWPGLTLITLVLFYGAYALIDGVCALAAAFTGGAKPVPTWWLVVVGILGILAGLVTFLWPGIIVLIAPGAGALALVWIIGVYSLAFGVLLVGLSLRLRRHRHG